jgi:hypothetical protein
MRRRRRARARATLTWALVRNGTGRYSACSVGQRASTRSVNLQPWSYTSFGLAAARRAWSHPNSSAAAPAAAAAGSAIAAAGGSAAGARGARRRRSAVGAVGAGAVGAVGGCWGRGGARGVAVLARAARVGAAACISGAGARCAAPAVQREWRGGAGGAAIGGGGGAAAMQLRAERCGPDRPISPRPSTTARQKPYKNLSQQIGAKRAGAPVHPAPPGAARRHALAGRRQGVG